jgi:hypothetical protein
MNEATCCALRKSASTVTFCVDWYALKMSGFSPASQGRTFLSSRSGGVCRRTSTPPRSIFSFASRSLKSMAVHGGALIFVPAGRCDQRGRTDYAQKRRTRPADCACTAWRIARLWCRQAAVKIQRSHQRSPPPINDRNPPPTTCQAGNNAPARLGRVSWSPVAYSGLRRYFRG